MPTIDLSGGKKKKKRGPVIGGVEAPLPTQAIAGHEIQAMPASSLQAAPDLAGQVTSVTPRDIQQAGVEGYVPGRRKVMALPAEIEAQLEAQGLGKVDASMKNLIMAHYAVFKTWPDYSLTLDLINGGTVDFLNYDEAVAMFKSVADSYPSQATWKLDAKTLDTFQRGPKMRASGVEGFTGETDVLDPEMLASFHPKTVDDFLLGPYMKHLVDGKEEMFRGPQIRLDELAIDLPRQWAITNLGAALAGKARRANLPDRDDVALMKELNSYLYARVPKDYQPDRNAVWQPKTEAALKYLQLMRASALYISSDGKDEEAGGFLSTQGFGNIINSLDEQIRVRVDPTGKTDELKRQMVTDMYLRSRMPEESERQAIHQLYDLNMNMLPLEMQRSVGQDHLNSYTGIIHGVGHALSEVGEALRIDDLLASDEFKAAAKFAAPIAHDLGKAIGVMTLPIEYAFWPYVNLWEKYSNAGIVALRNAEGGVLPHIARGILTMSGVGLGTVLLQRPEHPGQGPGQWSNEQWAKFVIPGVNMISEFVAAYHALTDKDGADWFGSIAHEFSEARKQPGESALVTDSALRDLGISPEAHPELSFLAHFGFDTLRDFGAGKAVGAGYTAFKGTRAFCDTRKLGTTLFNLRTISDHIIKMTAGQWDAQAEKWIASALSEDEAVGRLTRLYGMHPDTARDLAVKGREIAKGRVNHGHEWIEEALKSHHVSIRRLDPEAWALRKEIAEAWTYAAPGKGIYRHLNATSHPFIHTMTDQVWKQKKIPIDMDHVDETMEFVSWYYRRIFGKYTKDYFPKLCDRLAQRASIEGDTEFARDIMRIKKGGNTAQLGSLIAGRIQRAPELALEYQSRTMDALLEQKAKMLMQVGKENRLTETERDLQNMIGEAQRIFGSLASGERRLEELIPEERELVTTAYKGLTLDRMINQDTLAFLHEYPASKRFVKRMLKKNPKWAAQEMERTFEMTGKRELTIASQQRRWQDAQTNREVMQSKTSVAPEAEAGAKKPTGYMPVQGTWGRYGPEEASAVQMGEAPARTAQLAGVTPGQPAEIDQMIEANELLAALINNRAVAWGIPTPLEYATTLERAPEVMKQAGPAIFEADREIAVLRERINNISEALALGDAQRIEQYAAELEDAIQQARGVHLARQQKVYDQALKAQEAATEAERLRYKKLREQHRLEMQAWHTELTQKITEARRHFATLSDLERRYWSVLGAEQEAGRELMGAKAAADAARGIKVPEGAMTWLEREIDMEPPPQRVYDIAKSEQRMLAQEGMAERLLINMIDDEEIGPLLQDLAQPYLDDISTVEEARAGQLRWEVTPDEKAVMRDHVWEFTDRLAGMKNPYEYGSDAARRFDDAKAVAQNLVEGQRRWAEERASYEQWQRLNDLIRSQAAGERRAGPAPLVRVTDAEGAGIKLADEYPALVPPPEIMDMIDEVLAEQEIQGTKVIKAMRRGEGGQARLARNVEGDVYKDPRQIALETLKEYYATMMTEDPAIIRDYLHRMRTRTGVPTLQMPSPTDFKRQMLELENRAEKEGGIALHADKPMPIDIATDTFEFKVGYRIQKDEEALQKMVAEYGSPGRIKVYKTPDGVTHYEFVQITDQEAARLFVKQIGGREVSRVTGSIRDYRIQDIIAKTVQERLFEHHIPEPGQLLDPELRKPAFFPTKGVTGLQSGADLGFALIMRKLGVDIEGNVFKGFLPSVRTGAGKEQTQLQGEVAKFIRKLRGKKYSNERIAGEVKRLLEKKGIRWSERGEIIEGPLGAEERAQLAMEASQRQLMAGEVKIAGVRAMHYEMPAKMNVTGKATTTIDLAESGKRTSSTRGPALGEVGDIIQFKDPKTGKPRPQLYEITGVRKLTREDLADPEFVKMLEKSEGWTAEAIRKNEFGPRKVKAFKPGNITTYYKKITKEQALAKQGLESVPERGMTEPTRATQVQAWSKSYSTNLKKRTEYNVVNSDATVIFVHDDIEKTAGSKLTRDLARKHGKPYLVVNVDDPQAALKVDQFLRIHRPPILNGAGQRTVDELKIAKIMETVKNEQPLTKWRMQYEGGLRKSRITRQPGPQTVDTKRAEALRGEIEGPVAPEGPPPEPYTPDYELLTVRPGTPPTEALRPGRGFKVNKPKLGENPTWVIVDKKTGNVVEDIGQLAEADARAKLDEVVRRDTIEGPPKEPEPVTAIPHQPPAPEFEFQPSTEVHGQLRFPGTEGTRYIAKLTNEEAAAAKKLNKALERARTKEGVLGQLIQRFERVSKNREIAQRDLENAVAIQKGGTAWVVPDDPAEAADLHDIINAFLSETSTLWRPGMSLEEDLDLFYKEFQYARKAAAEMLAEPERAAVMPIAQPAFNFQLHQWFEPEMNLGKLSKFTAGGVVRWAEFANAYKLGGLWSIDDANTAYKTIILARIAALIRIPMADEAIRFIPEGINPIYAWRGASWMKKFDKMPPDTVMEIAELFERLATGEMRYIRFGDPQWWRAYMKQARAMRQDPVYLYWYAAKRQIEKETAQLGKEAAKEAESRWWFSKVQSWLDEAKNREVDAKLVAHVQNLYRAGRPDAAYLVMGMERGRGPLYKIAYAGHRITRRGEYSMALEDFAVNLVDQGCRYWYSHPVLGKHFKLAAGDIDEAGRLSEGAHFGEFDGPQGMRDYERMKKAAREWAGTDTERYYTDAIVIGRDEGVVTGTSPLLAGVRDKVYKVLDTIGSKMKECVYAYSWLTEKEALEELAKKEGLDWSEEFIERRAHHAARTYTESVMFNGSVYYGEDLLRNIFMFLPAYRQFLEYWVPTALKKPYVAGAIYRANTMQKDKYGNPIGFSWIRPGFAPGMQLNLGQISFLVNQEQGSWTGWLPSGAPLIVMPISFMATVENDNRNNRWGELARHWPFQFGGAFRPLNSPLDKMFYGITGSRLPWPFGSDPDRDPWRELMATRKDALEGKWPTAKGGSWETRLRALGEGGWNFLVPIGMRFSDPEVEKLVMGRKGYSEAKTPAEVEKILMDPDNQVLNLFVQWQNMPSYEQFDFLKRHPEIIPYMVSGFDVPSSQQGKVGFLWSQLRQVGIANPEAYVERLGSRYTQLEKVQQALTLRGERNDEVAWWNAYKAKHLNDHNIYRLENEWENSEGAFAIGGHFFQQGHRGLKAWSDVLNTQFDGIDDVFRGISGYDTDAYRLAKLLYDSGGAAKKLIQMSPNYEMFYLAKLNEQKDAVKQIAEDFVVRRVATRLTPEEVRRAGYSEAQTQKIMDAVITIDQLWDAADREIAPLGKYGYATSEGRAIRKEAILRQNALIKSNPLMKQFLGDGVASLLMHSGLTKPIWERQDFVDFDKMDKTEIEMFQHLHREIDPETGKVRWSGPYKPKTRDAILREGTVLGYVPVKKKGATVAWKAKVQLGTITGYVTVKQKPKEAETIELHFKEAMRLMQDSFDRGATSVAANQRWRASVKKSLPEWAQQLVFDEVRAEGWRYFLDYARRERAAIRDTINVYYSDTPGFSLVSKFGKKVKADLLKYAGYVGAVSDEFSTEFTEYNGENEMVNAILSWYL